jgi:hypothetical protein
VFSQDLFLANQVLDTDTYRNIVSLRESVNLFDELSDDPFDQAVAVQAELETKKDIHPASPALIYKGFAYNTAIAYPFLTEPFLDTRFGDGSYGLWYGSMEMITTIYETCYHIYRAIVSVEDHPNLVKQERAVYTVHCNGILIDLSDKADAHPDLVANDYRFCQLIGKKLQKEGHPGILYESARTEGRNLAVFNPRILHNPRNNCYLTYVISTREKAIRVERDVAKELLTMDVAAVFGF